jgi:hypothetical protein
MKLFITLLLGVLVLFPSCKTKEDSNREVIESGIVLIDAPSKAIVGDNVKVTVHFTGHNGCTQPYSIEADKVGQTITLRAFYSLENDQICTANIQNFSLEYDFFADLPGPYFFISSFDNTISDTLVVQ